MEGGHQLAVGIKGQLPQTGVVPAVKFLVYADAVPQHDQGHLRGVADGGTVLHIGGGVTGQEGRLQEQPLHIVYQIQVVPLQKGAVGVDLLGRHPVLGESAGLVGADHRHRAQRLHRLEVLDDGVLPCHLLGAHGLDDGNDGAEGLRDGGHRQRHGKHQRVQQRHMMEQGQGKYHHTDPQDGRGQLLAEVVQTLLEGGLALLGPVHQGGHLAQLGVHTRARDHYRGPPIGHQGAGKHHVFLVAQRHLLRGDHIRGLLHALALTSEGALIDLQRKIFQDSSVGHHHVAGLQLHNVARHHLGRRHHGPHAVPEHFCAGRGHGLQTLQGLLRLEVLDRTQYGVEDQDRKDDDRALHVIRHHGDQGRNDEDHHQQVLELVQKHLESGLLPPLRQGVFAVFLEALGRLLGSKPRLRPSEGAQGLIHGAVEK